MIRALAYLPFAAMLAACAAPQSEAPQAAAPAPVPSPAPVPEGPAYVATPQPDGVVRVKGPAKHEDDLAGHHCTAANIATKDGAATIEWVGGVARPLAEGFEADMAYQFGADPRAARWDEPEKGGAVLTANWLRYCDQAGIPREDRA